MEDVGEAVLDFRRDADFNHAIISAATDMDIDVASDAASIAPPGPSCLHPSLVLPDPMEIVTCDSGPLAVLRGAADGDGFDMATALSNLFPGSVGSMAGWKLYIVLDTNVLLSRATLRLLEQMSKRFGPGSGGVLEVAAILPWTVLLELDGLKSREGKGGEGSPKDGGADVSAQARAAITALRSALDNKESFYQ